MKVHHQFFINQSIELSSLSEIDNIIQEREVIFKINPAVGLPEVSRLTNSAISKRRGDQRKYSFHEKKMQHKRENGFIINTQKHCII